MDRVPVWAPLPPVADFGVRLEGPKAHRTAPNSPWPKPIPENVPPRPVEQVHVLSVPAQERVHHFGHRRVRRFDQELGGKRFVQPSSRRACTTASATFTPMSMQVRFVFARGICGMIDASAM